jgi:hypothetical protein
MFLRMLEAGEMFEGLPEFSVSNMLDDMGLDGTETARDLGIGATGRQVANRGQIPVDNSSPLSEGLDTENPEATVQPNEATGAII